MWKSFFEEECQKDYFKKLMERVDDAYDKSVVFPKREDLFAAFEVTDYPDVRVVLLGQDPYHGDHQAHGFCFSVPKGVKLPPSLRNIYKELHEDIGCPIPTHGTLVKWARQGVFLLNTTLSVEKGKPLSHQTFGWEQFTDEVIKEINKKQERVVFVLWGSHAQKKKKLISNSKHIILEGVHPSPLSAYRGFFGSTPFSKINQYLMEDHQKPIDWSLEENDV